MGIGWTEVALIVIVILLLFGATRLPAALGGLGKGIKEFKKAMREDDKPAEGDAHSVAEQLRPGVGKHVRLLPDGTLEVGVPEGSTLVEVDQAWVICRGDGAIDRIPIISVKRIVYKA